VKVKWWYLPAGLGGVLIISCYVIALGVVVNTGTKAIAYYCADRAEDYDDGGEYEEAVKWYGWALKLRRGDWRYHYGKAEALSELGRWEGALETYDGALALEPPYIFLEDVYVGKARALAGLGRWEEAVKAYAEAINRRLAGPFEDLCDTGTVLLESETYEVTVGRPFDIHPSIWEPGKYVEVIAYFKAAAKLEPKNSYPHYMEGRAWLELEQYEKAASCFGAAAELAPDHAPAWTGKAWALGLLGRYEAALECADRALALDADDPDAWNTKGKILMFSGEAGAARECFDRALAQYPSSAEALLARGITYLAEAAYDDARAYFEELSRADGAAYYLLYLYLVDSAEGRPGTDRLQPLLEAPPDPWLKKLSLFLVGRLSAEDLLAEAADDDEKLCEAHFFIGYKNKLDGDAAAARRHFGEAAATGQVDAAEYYLARYELARVGAAEAR
jgi:tetratricopeptide (TPR) repeat protein